MVPINQLKKLNDIQGVREFLPSNTHFDSDMNSIAIPPDMSDTTIDTETLLKKRGETALTYACWHGLGILIKTLVEEGADLNIPNAQSEYPIAIAFHRCDKFIFNYLLHKISDSALSVEISNMYPVQSTDIEPEPPVEITLTLFDNIILSGVEIGFLSQNNLNNEMMQAIENFRTSNNPNCKILMAYVNNILTTAKDYLKDNTRLNIESISLISEYSGGINNFSILIPQLPINIQNQFVYYCQNAKDELESDTNFNNNEISNRAEENKKRKQPILYQKEKATQQTTTGAQQHTAVAQLSAEADPSKAKNK